MKYCVYCMSKLENNDIECPFCGRNQDNTIPGHHLIPGTVLNNKYYIGASIGEGGFGITYIGRDLTLDMKVAVKEFYLNGYVNRSNSVSQNVNCATTPEVKEFFEKGKDRYLREARILARFSGSSGIVDVRDFFEENNTAYIVMEYLEGETLQDYLKRNGTMSPENALRLLIPVMLSLKEVHEQGLIHRDISPQNIMIVGNQVKLLDFGAARNFANIGNKSLSVVLKPGYAPEEQYRSKGEQGPWTDIYALCATLYKCITGITPEDATQRVFRDEVKTPSALGIHIDTNIENAIMRGLSVLQRDRYQSIDELIDGFKGLKNNDGSDDITVTVTKPVSEDDKDTGIIKKDTGDDDEEPASGNAEDESDPKAIINNENHVPRAEKPENRQKRIITVCLMVLAVVVAVSVIAVIIKTRTPDPGSGSNKDYETVSVINNNLKVDDAASDDETNDDTESVVFNDKELTVDDLKSLTSFEKIWKLVLDTCRINNDIIKYIGDNAHSLKVFTISDCTGVTDYSPISNLNYLTRLTIQNCGLANDQLSGIELSDCDQLTFICLEGNEQLSDLKPLSAVSDTLAEINVDKTAVSDFSCLADCSVLHTVSARDCLLTSLTSLTNKTIEYLYVDNNRISDISTIINYDSLKMFEANNNTISDISALSEQQNLVRLYLDDNRIASLLPLENCSKITSLSINRNKLTSLDGLQNAIALNIIRASGNHIADLDGIINCTIIQTIDLNDNEINDISLLSKSAESLVTVCFNNNKVSDISALTGTTALQKLSFDNNEITSLEPLKQSTALLAISADNNSLTSLSGIENSTKLGFIYLSNNRIEEMSAFDKLVSNSESGFCVIDLSGNNITEFNMSADKKCNYLSVYNNPITSYQNVQNYKGTRFFFSALEGLDYSVIGDSFTRFSVVNCPVDKQIKIEDSLKAGNIMTRVEFQTDVEADQIIADTKSHVLSDDATSTFYLYD